MKEAARIGIAAAAACASLAIGGAVFLQSGFYDIGADDHHTKIVLGLIERLRERSIQTRAHAIVVPSLEDPAKIADGARRYASLCAGCHLAPGAAKSEIRTGMYPHPPSLAQEETRDARAAFWTIKHGIKMSAMPAWGKTLDDPAIWAIVAFVRRMPSMTPEGYRMLSRRDIPADGAISRGNY